VNVTDRMKRARAVIGGEGNGGVIYPDVNFGRDSFVGMALVLHLMQDEKKSISELVGRLPHYTMLKTTRQVASDQVPQLLDKLKHSYRDKKLDLQDGIKIEMDGAWVHVRPSNTEPIVRVVAEASTKESAEQLIREVDALLK
jgi:phosphomannomutase